MWIDYELNWTIVFFRGLQLLVQRVYPQPPDPGSAPAGSCHSARPMPWSRRVCRRFRSPLEFLEEDQKRSLKKSVWGKKHINLNWTHQLELGRYWFVFFNFLLFFWLKSMVDTLRPAPFRRTAVRGIFAVPPWVRSQKMSEPCFRRQDFCWEKYGKSPFIMDNLWTIYG